MTAYFTTPPPAECMSMQGLSFAQRMDIKPDLGGGHVWVVGLGHSQKWLSTGHGACRQKGMMTCPWACIFVMWHI